MVKLTKAQTRVLAELGERDGRGDRMSDDYAPIAKLYELGLASKSDYAFGSSTYRITEAGRAALEQPHD